MSKDTRALSGVEAWQRTEALDAIESPELLTLKAHALLDGVLARVVAGRLGIAVNRLPSLSFAHVSELSLAAEQLIEHLRPAINRLNQARNDIAHEWQAAGLGTHMRRLAEDLGIGPWPTDPKAQLGVFRVALKNLIAEANGAAHFAAMSAEDWQAFEADLRRRAAESVASLSRDAR